MKIISIIFSVLFLLVVVFLSYMGVFTKVNIKEQEMGPYTFAYVEHTGPYQEVGKPMMELDKKMRGLGFNSTDGIGIYYDDPEKTPKEKLRSEVGSVISADDMSKIAANQDNLNFKTIEKNNYLIAEFPIKNVFSYMLGPIKIYPAFGKYLENNNIPVPDKGIELYDMKNKKIIYMMACQQKYSAK